MTQVVTSSTYDLKYIASFWTGFTRKLSITNYGNIGGSIYTGALHNDEDANRSKGIKSAEM